MEISALIDQLQLHGDAMADAADEAALDAPVPTCPGWDVRALLSHVGMVHRWAAGIVRAEPDAAAKSEFPAPASGVVEWFRDGHAALVGALRAAPQNLEVWSFLPAPSPLAFWARRQAHETAIHRADVEAVLGTTPAYTAEFAADGIAELLEGFYGRKGGRFRSDPGFVVAVSPDDVATSWTIEVRGDGRTIHRHDGDHTDPTDCIVRGAATDLYLDVWNRSRPESTRIEGDPMPMQRWRELAKVSWS